MGSKTKTEKAPKQHVDVTLKPRAEPDAELEVASPSGPSPSSEKTKKIAPKKFEKKPAAPLVAPTDASVAQQILREAPSKYEDINTLLGIEPKPKKPLPAKGGSPPPQKKPAAIAEDGEGAQAQQATQGPRKTYGGKLEKGKFVKAPMEYELMSEADRQACLSDIESTKTKKYAEVEMKKRQYDEKMQKKKDKQQKAYD